MFFIKTYFNNTTNISVTGLLNTAYGKSSIKTLGDSVYSYVVSSVRHVVDKSNNCSYLEFYYNVSEANGISIELISSKVADREWTCIELEKTDETVSGVEVYSSISLKTKENYVVTNSHLPIMESHLVNPNGSNTIKINLQNNTTVERVQVTLASLIDLQISGMTVRAGAYNTVEIILSKTYSGTIRVNVLYYKT